MRIIAGRWGGRQFPGPSGDATRPTAERVREALFSILGERLAGARVLDLYAGTGALGLEALSRGAAHAVFVERDRRAVRALQDVVRALGAEAEVRPVDALRAVRDAAAAAESYDLVLLDPPYRLAPALGQELGQGLAGILAPGATVVAEMDRRAPLELPWEPVTERRYGDTVLRIHQP